MKKSIIIAIAIFYSSVSAQNIEDAYEDRTTSELLWPNVVDEGYDGEYQIFLDKFFWNTPEDGYNLLEPSAISFSIEVVSFPFIPKGDLADIEGTLPRELTTALADDNSVLYGYLESYTEPGGDVIYSGLGWQYDGFKIYQKLDNINSCDDNLSLMCSGHYGLVSQAYYNNLSPGPYYEMYCHLPHTILKHTLYFHCGEDIDDEVIDSISWIYDNTRGRMRDYPFDVDDHRQPPTLNIPCDVVFRPTFNHYFDGYGSSWIPYSPAWEENSDYYNSGLTGNTGSINYYPAEEAIASLANNCPDYPYYDANGTGGDFYSWHDPSLNNEKFISDFVHPPPFALLDAPLLNFNAKRYAGFSDSGDIIEGSTHQYRIESPFDLRIINPSEKIIYNPSEVTIDCDGLIFPCGYKFLTLHGKYPDKQLEVHHGGDFSSQYWDQNPFFKFKHDWDYPTPVNHSTNDQHTSTYILDDRTLIIQPYVIIMDAKFVGTSASKKSYIIYDPRRTYGNWTFDPVSIVLIPHEFNELGGCEIVHESKQQELEQIIGLNTNLNEYFKILNGGAGNPQIQFITTPPYNSIVKVFDYSGNLVREKMVTHSDKTIDCSDFTRGVYFCILVVEGRVIQKTSFSKTI